MSIIEDTYEWLNAVENPCLKTADLTKKVELIRDLLNEELNEFLVALENNDIKEQKNAIVDLLWVASNLGFFSGIALPMLEEEAKLVKKSNFSKFCKTHDEAHASVLAYMAGIHPNKQGEIIRTEIKETGRSEYPYYIARKPDGKIMKALSFKDVNQF